MTSVLFGVIDTVLGCVALGAVYWLGVRKREWLGAIGALCFAIAFLSTAWLTVWPLAVLRLPVAGVALISIQAFLPRARKA